MTKMITSMGKMGYLINALEQLAIQLNWLCLTPHPKISPSWTLPEFQLWWSNVTLHTRLLLLLTEENNDKIWTQYKKRSLESLGEWREVDGCWLKVGGAHLLEKEIRSSASSSVSSHGSAHSSCRETGNWSWNPVNTRESWRGSVNPHFESQTLHMPKTQSISAL